MRDAIGAALFAAGWFWALCALQPAESRDNYGVGFMVASAMCVGVALGLVL